MSYHKLLVVKIGTSSLTDESGVLSYLKLNKIVDQIAKIKQDGYMIILVTSGAIAAGYTRLGFKNRPTTIAGKQAAAAVGQALFMEEYNKAFNDHSIVTAQILLTKDDFKDKRRYQNAWRSLEVLLNHKVIPIINENDSVSIDELKFGDNDRLSAQVAAMVHAKMLILATDIDGLYTKDPKIDPNAHLIKSVDKITPDIKALAQGSKSKNGTGGMSTKIIAAKIATTAGVFTFICNSNTEDILIKAVHKNAVGTSFLPINGINTRKQWLAYHALSKGKLIIDHGAKIALCENGKSLLPIGIKHIEGSFVKKDVVEVYLENYDQLLGKGIINFDAEKLRTMIGLPTNTIQQNEDNSSKTVVIHHNNWISNLSEDL